MLAGAETAPASPASGAEGPAPRLVAVSPTALVSGAEVVLLRALTAAVDAGWEVECACADGPLAAELAARGVARIDLPDLRLPPGPRLRALAILLARSGRAARRLRRATTDCDVVLVNGVHALPALRMARLRAPAAWLVHDVILRRDRLAFLRIGGPAVDLAIAVSSASAAPVERIGVRTVVVRNGTPWPVAASRPPAGAVHVVGCSAVLTPWKGQDVLLDAVAMLDREDVLVELAGQTLPKDGPYAEALRARAARPDLSGHVRFLGHVDDPVDAMRDWTIAVNSSVEPEAGSLAVLEAMSVGVPLVCTDHGGTPEYLGGAGLLVEPGDPVALAAAISRLLDDPDLRARCSSAGRAAVADSLSLDGQIRRLLEVLAELARSGARPG